MRPPASRWYSIWISSAPSAAHNGSASTQTRDTISRSSSTPECPDGVSGGDFFDVCFFFPIACFKKIKNGQIARFTKAAHFLYRPSRVYTSVERATRLELATPSLGSLYSTN